MGQVFTAQLPAVGAAATVVEELGVVPSYQDSDNVIAAITLTSTVAQPITATNYMTYNVRQLRAGAVVGTVATLTTNTGGTALVAETPVSLPLTPQVGQLKTGDVLDVQAVSTGTATLAANTVVAEAELN